MHLSPKTYNLKTNRGFTLIELLMYSAIFVVVVGVLTTVLITGLRSHEYTTASSEVTQQLDLVLSTVQRIVRDGSLIEMTHEGDSVGTECTTHCTLRIRTNAAATDPTIITSNASGVFIKEGEGATTTLTTSRVTVDFLRFIKHEVAGGHAAVAIDASFSYNSPSPQLVITKTLQSAVSRVTAATFDADMLPNADNTWSIGQISPNSRWKHGRFSGDMTIEGNVGIGTTAPVQRFQINDTATTAFVVTSAGRVGIGTTSPGAKLDIAGDLIIGVGGAGKLTVGTVDPVFTIGGIQYATYMAGMIGVKEETVGLVSLQATGNELQAGGKEYKYVLDFKNAETGSDLWLFSKTSALHENFDRLVVLLTPSFPGDVWYTKNTENMKVTIYGEKGGEVSYRLTAPRFDWAQWTNYAEVIDGIYGFILD